jgi:two-component system, sensor histidine kinase PdtaS
MHTTALQNPEGLASKYNISESRVCVAGALFDLGRYDEAIAQAEIILAENGEKQSLSHEQRAYDVLAKAHEAKASFELALIYHKQYKAISDSIFNQDIQDKVAEKDAKFDLAEHEAKIAFLDAKNENAKLIIQQKSRTILLAEIGLGLATILSIFLFFVGQKYLRQRRVLAKANTDIDTLLREIHHRVKNNLQVVSSLLSLQGRTISDKVALKASNDGKSRVRSMALIHQDLYQHDNLTGVNVKGYLVKLYKELFATYQIDEDRIQLNLDIDADTLVP